MAPRQDLQPDVTERVDQQRGRGLGVRGAVQRLALASEQQLVADDAVTLVRDWLAYDRDVRAPGGGIGGDGHLLPSGRHIARIVQRFAQPIHNPSTCG